MITIPGHFIKAELCENWRCRPAHVAPIDCTVQAELDPNGEFGTDVGTAAINGETFRMHYGQYSSGTRVVDGTNGSHSLTLFITRGLRKAIFEVRLSDGRYYWYTCGYGGGK